jgi:RNA polymerase sigma-54 factor
MRRLRLNQEELQNGIDLIQSMNPSQGGQRNEARSEYITPDVYVKKVKGRWRVGLNPELMPQLRVNSSYAGMIRRADNSEDNVSLKAHLQEARWFIKSLQSRSETLLRVATCIVERQRAFLEYGEEAMKPMILHDVAEALGMHESTISRVTTRKYMHTPRGIFELKYFFSSHLSTSHGGEASSTAIRAFIKKLIGAEVPLKPLSDSKISSLLLEQGIKVARRTVAKYREAMAIPPSNERKRLA